MLLFIYRKLGKINMYKKLKTQKNKKTNQKKKIKYLNNGLWIK